MHQNVSQPKIDFWDIQLELELYNISYGYSLEDEKPISPIANFFTMTAQSEEVNYLT